MKQLCMMAAVVAAAGSFASAGVVLDGQADAGYSTIATDPNGDLANPGPATWTGVAWTDLTVLRATNDATDLYVHIAMPSYAAASSAGSWGLAVDVNGTTAGGTSDPWGNAISYTGNLPDFHMRGNTQADGSWTELRKWNGNWDTGGGTNVAASNTAWSDTNGLELKISLATLGVGAGDTVNLLFFGTQPGAGKGAYDTLGNGDQSTGWDDATTHNSAAAYTITAVPEPAGLALLGGLGLLGLVRRRRGGK